MLNHPEVVGCQIGHPDMEVVASLSKATKQGEVDPSYEFWLPLVGGCGLYYHDSPYRIEGNLGADFVKGGSGADKMYGGLGNDKAGGGPGNDSLSTVERATNICPVAMTKTRSTVEKETI